MAVILRYFTEFDKLVFRLIGLAVTESICGRIHLCTSLLYFVLRVRCRRRESSRSLSHLLMSFLFARCYGWGATWENRFKIGVLLAGGSISAKLSRKREHPPPIIFTRIHRPMHAIQLCRFSHRVMWEDFGVLVTARAREFWMFWSFFIWDCGRL